MPGYSVGIIEMKSGKGLPLNELQEFLKIFKISPFLGLTSIALLPKYARIPASGFGSVSRNSSTSNLLQKEKAMKKFATFVLYVSSIVLAVGIGMSQAGKEVRGTVGALPPCNQGIDNETCDRLPGASFTCTTKHYVIKGAGDGRYGPGPTEICSSPNCITEQSVVAVDCGG
jgi:hypothetical protein